MPTWLQHTLVIALALICLAIVLRQMVGALRRRNTRLGQCCPKGCPTDEPAKSASQRIIFLPAELLSKRK